MGTKLVLPLFRQVDDDKLILFVHGLSGSAEGTWGQMIQMLVSDERLKTYSFDCYEYPTSKFRLPLMRKMSSIQEIAEGLRSFIEYKHNTKKEIIFVAHSLGGLISRFFILDAVKSGRDHKAIGLLLYASPLSGAGLAAIASVFSWRHRHLKQLTKNTDFLSLLNSDWVKLQVEPGLRVLNVVGESDAIVSRESSLVYGEAYGDKGRTLTGRGHIDITKPESDSDDRFVSFREFCLSLTSSLVERPMPAVKKPGDVLFDNYNYSVEDFYLNRHADGVVSEASKSSHLWISGPPGVGKTAALRRLVEISGWDFQHVILDGFQGLTALELMREVGSILCERVGLIPPVVSTIDTHSVVKIFRLVFSSLANGCGLTILIEEIPLRPGTEYSAFIDLAYQLSLLAEGMNRNGRVVLLFSSVNCPRVNIRAGFAKLFDKIQFIKFEPWSSREILELMHLIEVQVKSSYSSVEKDLIVSKCSGSPRFLKMFYRNVRSEVGARKGLHEMLELVRKDLA